MKKSKFLKSVIILVIGGFITKLLGMVIKIVLTRTIGTTGIGIYMLIMPTYMLLISIAQLGFPVAISKLVAENKFNNRSLVLGIMPISLFINLIIFIFLILFGSFISNNLLHDSRTYYGIIAIGFVLPFISISSIMRGYFFGKERMLPHTFSNIIEDVIRLLFIIFVIPLTIPLGIEYTIFFLILSSILSELSSIIIFIICAPKKMDFRKNIVPKKNNVRNILSISLPATGSRLIGNIGYFLEPIILTFVLIHTGYDSEFIINEYGIINGYVLPLILLPSFFTMAISQSLIPIISKSYSDKNLNYTRSKIKQAVNLSLLIGIPATLIFIFIPNVPLKLIYNTDIGINYLRVLAPICLLHYIQGPITSSLQAMGKAKVAMKGTLYGMILRTSTLFIFSYLKIGLWGLIIAISINIIFVTLHQIKKVIKALKN